MAQMSVKSVHLLVVVVELVLQRQYLPGVSVLPQYALGSGIVKGELSACIFDPHLINLDELYQILSLL